MLTGKQAEAGPVTRAGASNFRQFACSGEGVREERGVQGRALAFAGDALLARISLEQVQRELAEQGEIGRPVAALDAAVVLPETNVQLPMLVVPATMRSR